MYELDDEQSKREFYYLENNNNKKNDIEMTILCHVGMLFKKAI